MTADTNVPTWGEIPAPVAKVIDLLAKVAAREANQLTTIDWPRDVADVGQPLAIALGHSQRAIVAATELRALLSAYAHVFHNPRPVLAALARAQQTSSQGFVRRYSDKTVAAIDELLSDTPDVTVILRGFTALAASDLAGIDGPVGMTSAMGGSSAGS